MSVCVYMWHEWRKRLILYIFHRWVINISLGNNFIWIKIFNKVFVFFLGAPWHMELPGHGSDLGHSGDLSLSCGSTRSLTHCAWLGIEPAFQHSQDSTNPIALQQEHQYLLFKTKFIFLVLLYNFDLKFSFCSLGPNPWAMEVPRLGVELEL